uniref:Cytochrome b561 domain-containing protein n=1 Tax=Glossina pallidipes TaxID=7398 RepID=A0A1A9ZN24_GLOPL
MLKITTIIAFLLLIPYLILGAFLVYFLYEVESCRSIWYYNIEMDDLDINEHTLAVIDSHYKNTTIIPDRKFDSGLGESIYSESDTTTEQGEEDGVLADWLDINNLRLPSNVITNRPWTAHARPTETLEEKEEDEHNPAAESEDKTELSPTDDTAKRRRKLKSSKRRRGEKSNKGHRTEDSSRDLRFEKKKSRKAHKTGKTGQMDKIDNTDNIDDTIPGEVDEPMPTPLRFAQQSYCTSPYHGMLCMLGTVLMGLSIVTFRVLHNVKTRLVKLVHTIINSIAILILVAGVVELKFETIQIHAASAFHVVSSWLVLACLLFEVSLCRWTTPCIPLNIFSLQFLTAIVVFWILFRGSKNRLFLAPFHDIFGIWIFICLVGCCLSGKRVVIGDYKPANIFKFYCFTYAAFVIVLIILLSPWFEWDLVSYSRLPTACFQKPKLHLLHAPPAGGPYVDACKKSLSWLD